jgi:hypothetical protein
MHLSSILRPLCIPLALALASCSASGNGTAGPAPMDTAPSPGASPSPTAEAGDDAGLAPLAAPTSGYQIVTPDYTIAAGDEKFFCYYTTLPSTTTVGVTKYQSQLVPGSHHMILYATPTNVEPDGTLVECNDGLAGGAVSGDSFPTWAYATQTPNGQLDMPPGVAVVLSAKQPLMVNMHYLNATSGPLTVHVTLNIETLAAGVSYTPASAFVTYNTQISIPPHATATFGGSCDVPAGVQFFEMSTHSHSHTVMDTISDGTQTILTTMNWSEPTVGLWSKPYYEFSSGKLSYQCQYSNETDSTVVAGNSAELNEMCMAVGYMFPATETTFCLNSTEL